MIFVFCIGVLSFFYRKRKANQYMSFQLQTTCVFVKSSLVGIALPHHLHTTNLFDLGGVCFLAFY